MELQISASEAAVMSMKTMVTSIDDQSARALPGLRY